MCEDHCLYRPFLNNATLGTRPSINNLLLPSVTGLSKSLSTTPRWVFLPRLAHDPVAMLNLMLFPHYSWLMYAGQYLPPHMEILKWSVLCTCVL